MKYRSLKYALSYLIPLGVLVSFLSSGWMSFFGLIEAFVLIPIFELIFGTNSKNLSSLQKELATKDKWYDWIVYLNVPMQYAFLIWFVLIIPDVPMFSTEFWGKTLSFGLLCGVIGINVAHELGHRLNKMDKFLSKTLLLSSLYMHFYIEHNYGHHKRVATKEDPATARYNENIYFFWIRSVLLSFISAWKIQFKMLKRNKKNFWSWQNEMLRYMIIQSLLLVSLYMAFGWYATMAFTIAAWFGILLLETVNYIEHYGLERRMASENRYEDVEVTHSWNSDHVLGRTMLYELTRHSDHHANPNKKYQVLAHSDESPQLPTGYPGMMLIATLPPIWFWIMNRRIKRAKS